MSESKIKQGDIVDYHSVIGGEITSYEHRVESVFVSSSGSPVAFISRKSGYVSVDALTVGISEFHPLCRDTQKELMDRIKIIQALKLGGKGEVYAVEEIIKIKEAIQTLTECEKMRRKRLKADAGEEC